MCELRDSFNYRLILNYLIVFTENFCGFDTTTITKTHLYHKFGIPVAVINPAKVIIDDYNESFII